MNAISIEYNGVKLPAELLSFETAKKTSNEIDLYVSINCDFLLEFEGYTAPEIIKELLANFGFSSLDQTGLVLIKKRNRNVLMFAPYKNGQPQLKAQSLLRRLNRKGAYYTLEAKK